MDVQETGMETFARWVVLVSPLLVMIGMVGIYVEIQAPGMGWAGLTGVLCFALFFTGHMIAGLSGYEAAVLFVLGLSLIAVELLFLPGTILPGLLGGGLVVFGLLMAMADAYAATSAPTIPLALPTAGQLKWPLLRLAISFAGAVALIVMLANYLPRSRWFRGAMVLDATSGSAVDVGIAVGDEGTADTTLRPSGKAAFGDLYADVVAEGEFIERGARVRVVEVEGARVVVERA